MRIGNDGSIHILLGLGTKGKTDPLEKAAALLAYLNHEMAEAALYSGMDKLSPLQGQSRSDIEALAVALSQRVAESSNLTALANQGLRIFLGEALNTDLKRVDAQRLALGLWDQLVRDSKNSEIRAATVRNVVSLAGAGHSLLEMTGTVVFPKVLTIDARSFFTKGKFNRALWKSVSASVPDINILIADNLDEGASAQREILRSLLEKRIRMAPFGVGLRNGKIDLVDVMKTIPGLFGWDKSIVPMVRVGVATTDTDLWTALDGIIPLVLAADMVANISDAFKLSRVMDLSA